MKIDFRHGIISCQTDIFRAPKFVRANSGDPLYVDFLADPTPTVITFAHGENNYTVSLENTVEKAWGPFAFTSEQYYLYWDLDLVSAVVTYGATRYAPHVSNSAPPFDRTDQHWYDTSTMRLKVQQSDGSWVTRARVFAAHYAALGSLQPRSLGTQIDDFTTSVRTGFPIIDEVGRPLTKRDGSFVTTEDGLAIAKKADAVTQFRLEGEVTIAAALGFIPKNTCVTFVNPSIITPASFNNTEKPVMGFCTEEVQPGWTTHVITHGRVIDPNLNFDPYYIGYPLFIDVGGGLTVTPPPANKRSQIVGYVLDTQSFMLQLEQPHDYVASPTTGTVYRPLFDHPVTGRVSDLPNGAVINIGGTSSGAFTVDGKKVLLEDGTLAGGGLPTGFTLQLAYDSSDVAGEARVEFDSDKPMHWSNTETTAFLTWNPATGDLRVSGEIFSDGGLTQVVTTIEDTDHILLSPNDASTTALKIEPDDGVIPSARLFDVHRVFGDGGVFYVDALGNTHAQALSVAGNIAVTGTVDGVDVSQLATIVNTHVSVSSNKHLAQEINVNQSSLPAYPSGTGHVQAALEFLEQRHVTDLATISALQSQVAALENVVNTLANQTAAPLGYTHTQGTPATTWTVAHNKTTRNFVMTIFDAGFSEIQPDNVQVTDDDTVVITFDEAVAGRVNFIFYQTV